MSAFRSMFFAVALAAVCGAGTPAAAAPDACALKLADLGKIRWSGGRNGGYDVFDPATYREVVDFQVEGASGCSFAVGVTSTSSWSGLSRRLFGGSGLLRYQIFADSGLSAVLRDLPSATGSELLTGSISGGGAARVRFYIMIEPQQVVGPASYYDALDVRLYNMRTGLPFLSDQRRVTVEANVPSAVDLSFGDDFTSKPRSSLAFGELQRNAVRSLPLRARGNAGYKFRIASQNGGVMRPDNPRDDSVVPYALSIDNVAVSLDHGGAELLGLLTATSPAGQEHRLTVRIGDFSDASAGNYSDVLTVTVESLR